MADPKTSRTTKEILIDDVVKARDELNRLLKLAHDEEVYFTVGYSSGMELTEQAPAVTLRVYAVAEKPNELGVQGLIGRNI